MSKVGNGIAGLGSLVVLGLVAGTFMLIAADQTPDSMGTNALARQGFKQVKITDKDPWFAALKGCKITDTVIFTVKGNRKGDTVTKFVCAAPWAKTGSVIRP